MDIATYVAHLHIFSPLVAPFDHITTKADTTATESWAQRVIVISATAVGPLLIESAWNFKKTKIHASIVHTIGVENHDNDAA